jgi:DedD protein
MSQAPKAAVQITRKGLIIWAALFFFFAGWMFVLGILVGRGTAPVTLDMDRLEKELIALKSALIEKESSQLDNASGQPDKPAAELGFYEALKQTKPAPDFKVESSRPVPKLVETLPVPAAIPARPSEQSALKEVLKDEKPASTAQDDTTDKTAGSAGIPEIKAGGYTVQVAAFKNPANSSRMVTDLREKGFPAYQIQTGSDEGGSTLHRVRVGAFDNRQSAEAMLAQLHRQAVKGVLVETP